MAILKINLLGSILLGTCTSVSALAMSLPTDTTIQFDCVAVAAPRDEDVHSIKLITKLNGSTEVTLRLNSSEKTIPLIIEPLNNDSFEFPLNFTSEDGQTAVSFGFSQYSENDDIAGYSSSLTQGNVETYFRCNHSFFNKLGVKVDLDGVKAFDSRLINLSRNSSDHSIENNLAACSFKTGNADNASSHDTIEYTLYATNDKNKFETVTRHFNSKKPKVSISSGASVRVINSPMALHAIDTGKLIELTVDKSSKNSSQAPATLKFLSHIYDGICNLSTKY